MFATSRPFELSYKNDDLGDPLMNDYHAIALKSSPPARKSS